MDSCCNEAALVEEVDRQQIEEREWTKRALEADREEARKWAEHERELERALEERREDEWDPREKQWLRWRFFVVRLLRAADEGDPFDRPTITQTNK